MWRSSRSGLKSKVRPALFFELDVLFTSGGKNLFLNFQGLSCEVLRCAPYETEGSDTIPEGLSGLRHLTSSQ